MNLAQYLKNQVVGYRLIQIGSKITNNKAKLYLVQRCYKNSFPFERVLLVVKVVDESLSDGDVWRGKHVERLNFFSVVIRNHGQP